jgi:methyl-accepting chemotaxis protein
VNDYEILKNYIVEYNRFVCGEINELPQMQKPSSEPQILELYKLLAEGAECYKQKRNKENILFGQLGLGLFALKQGNFVHINANDDDTSMVAETINYLNDFVDGMAQTSAEVRTLSNAAKHGDFTLRVCVDKWQGDVGELARGINGLCSEINSMLALSYDNGTELYRAANTLKSSTNSLSAASVQQAAALTQSSSTLEEISIKVQANAVSADSMAVLASQAKLSAHNTMELAQDTACAIGEIDKAIAQINSALKSIENIASQTNILSLNAAIEATRAGASGRGFAVVATEVRKLAARSVEAAKQIKEITQIAQTKSNEGLIISKQMMCGLETLEAKITATAAGATAVAQASGEQMIGISQINEAIEQLDKVTQENADIAEETDAIADSVADMANNIVNDVNSKQFIS